MIPSARSWNTTGTPLPLLPPRHPPGEVRDDLSLLFSPASLQPGALADACSRSLHGCALFLSVVFPARAEALLLPFSSVPCSFHDSI